VHVRGHLALYVFLLLGVCACVCVYFYVSVSLCVSSMPFKLTVHCMGLCGNCVECFIPVCVLGEKSRPLYWGQKSLVFAGSLTLHCDVTRGKPLLNC
jgi:hypothetical protein